MPRNVAYYSDLLSENEREIKIIFSKYSPEETAFKPSQTIWSVDEILEHIVITEKSTTKLFDYDKPVINLDNTPDLPLRQLESIQKYLFKSIKLKAPDYIQPKGIENRDVILKTFETQRQHLKAILPERFPYFRKSQFPHPIFGPLVKEEWLYFTYIHAALHIRQMKKRLA